MNGNQWLIGVGVPSLFIRNRLLSLGVALEEARAA
jgi:hypothetical protein